MGKATAHRRRWSARAHTLGAVVAGLALSAAVLAAGAGPARAATVRAPALGVTAAALIDAKSGKLLYGRSPNSERAIASTTKLMTALIVLEHERLSTILTEPRVYYPSVDSQIGLAPGERMSVHDLMIAMLLPSADDAAEDLAYNAGHRSLRRFVGMMNARARQLGLTHTHYSTASGLDTPGNYSSAEDLVKLARYVLAHQPFFARVVALRSAVLKTGAHRRFVANRNYLIGRVPWMTGVKTGHTLQAGYVLVGSGTRAGMTLISAVLGTSSEGARDANTLALLNYGFTAFHAVRPVRRGAVVGRVPAKDRPGFRAALIATGTVSAVVARDATIATRVELVHRAHELVGPLPRHAVVGRVVVTAGGRTIGVEPLLLAKALPAVSALAILWRQVTGPGVLVALMLLVAAVGGALVVRGRRPRRRQPAGDEPEPEPQLAGDEPEPQPAGDEAEPEPQPQWQSRSRADREAARAERAAARERRAPELGTGPALLDGDLPSISDRIEARGP